MQLIATYAIPFVIAISGLLILLSKKDLFGEFLKGGRDGFVTSVKILPSLIMLVTAVSMFSESGALDALCGLFGGVAGLFQIPREVIPVILMRPVSGSAANAVMLNLLQKAGPDSFSGRAASILMGSSDTIFYTLSMYFSAAGIKKTRHALPCALINFLFCVLVSGFLTRIFYR